MLRLNRNKIIAYMMILILCAGTLSGCNNEDASQADNPQSADNADSQDNPAQNDQADNKDLEDAVAQALGDIPAQPVDNTSSTQPTITREEPAPAPIAETSPVAITRIEPDDVKPEAMGAGDTANAEINPDEIKPADPMFPVEQCEVEVNGIYKTALARDLLKEINSRRLEYGIGTLVQNTSLLACSDGRCKEQAYFIGHFRPDGRPFSSISPNGEVKGECIAIEYRTVNDIMEAWFSVNDSRVQIMNPFYTQCGISIYDIDGIYYIAAEFSY